MCLILFAYHVHPDYPLILAANRDEFYDRPTAKAGFWQDNPNLLGGRDLEAGGTWMAMDKVSGRFAMLTNYRNPADLKKDAPSRGELVTAYLNSGQSAEAYVHQMKNQEGYNGFNLIMGSANELWYCSNQFSGARRLPKGLYGLSNHLLNTDWPKVTSGKKKLDHLMIGGRISSGNLLDALYDDTPAKDHQLPDTGIGIEKERMLSPMFIKGKQYGTRCSTVVLIDRKSHVLFTERTYDTDTFEFKDREFEFRY